MCLLLKASHIICGSSDGSTINSMRVGDEINLNDIFE